MSDRVRSEPLDLDEVLARTVADRRLSRAERRAVADLLRRRPLGARRRRLHSSRAFDLVAEALARRHDRQLLGWLHEVVKLLTASDEKQQAGTADCCFAPEDDCADRLRQLLAGARLSLDVSVFTITDDRLSGALVDAHRRDVRVRILTDDEKALDPGSDIRRLAEAGVPVRTDRSEAHLHHKFAVVDRRLLVSGAYNWTRSASRHNYENFLLTDDRRLVGPYLDEFERLWKVFEPT